jgi:hypothetical protein
MNLEETQSGCRRNILGPADVYYYDTFGIIGGLLLELMKWFPKREK